MRLPPIEARGRDGRSLEGVGGHFPKISFAGFPHKLVSFSKLSKTMLGGPPQKVPLETKAMLLYEKCQLETLEAVDSLAGGKKNVL